MQGSRCWRPANPCCTAGPARSGIGMRFISRCATLKVKQSKVVPGAVCKLRDSRASSGRAASRNNSNNNNKPAALPSFDNTATEEPSLTTNDSGLLAYLILVLSVRQNSSVGHWR